MIVVLRETRVNRYTLNALTGILDVCGVERLVRRDRRGMVEALSDAGRRGERALALYSFVTPALLQVRDEVRAVAAAAPEAVLVAGGPHASADPEGTLALGFGHVFTGGAEGTLPEFLAAGGRGPSVIRAPTPDGTDLDRFPPIGRGRFGPVELTRGCAWGCGFCGVGRTRPRHRSRGSVLRAAEVLRSQGRDRIAFVTPDALHYAGGVGELDALLGELRSMGSAPHLGVFPSEVRPERVTPEALEVLQRHCQNRTLVIGVQSGSDAVLERLGRGHSVEDAVRAVRNARRFGFLPHVDLIFGFPGETAAERRGTVDLARRLRREAGARIHAHYFHPLPGTPLWGEDPSLLDAETRSFLDTLRKAGAEDGGWREQERWAWQVLDWARRGWVRTPRQ